MTGRAGRLVAVVAARRAAGQGRLAACMAEQRRLCAGALDLLSLARAAPAGGDAADMAQTARWQAHLRDEARAMQARAAGLEPELERLRAALALALGRERAIEALAETEIKAARRRAERRADDAVPDPGRTPHRRAGDIGHA